MTQKTTRRATVATLTFLIVILLGAMVVFGGCVKMIQKSSEPSITINASSPGQAGGNDISPIPNDTFVVQTPIPASEVMPVKSEMVTEVAPILTPDPYPIQHATRITETTRYPFLNRAPEFKKTYTLKGNATGLLVNVVEGPLYIVYTVTPQNDCLKNPASCRGTTKRSLNRPYMTITVRDNQTHEIVAEDGYGREYSSDTGNYPETRYTGGKYSATADSGETVSDPGKRYIPIYKEGMFHITIEGNYLDTELSIITGASPDPNSILMGSGS